MPTNPSGRVPARSIIATETVKSQYSLGEASDHNNHQPKKRTRAQVSAVPDTETSDDDFESLQIYSLKPSAPQSSLLLVQRTKGSPNPVLTSTSRANEAERADNVILDDDGWQLVIFVCMFTVIFQFYCLV
jgi:hypothetical protein